MLRCIASPTGHTDTAKRNNRCRGHRSRHHPNTVHHPYRSVNGASGNRVRFHKSTSVSVQSLSPQYVGLRGALRLCRVARCYQHLSTPVNTVPWTGVGAPRVAPRAATVCDSDMHPSRINQGLMCREGRTPRGALGVLTRDSPPTPRFLPYHRHPTALMRTSPSWSRPRRRV